MATLIAWDSHWQGIYEAEREEGATPNEAVAIADRETELQLGARPEPGLSAAELAKPIEEWS